jgi:hypothetical protein
MLDVLQQHGVRFRSGLAMRTRHSKVYFFRKSKFELASAKRTDYKKTTYKLKVVVT